MSRDRAKKAARADAAAQRMRERAAAALFAWHAADDFPSFSITREELPSKRTRIAPFADQPEETRALFLEGAAEVLRGLGFHRAAGVQS